MHVQKPVPVKGYPKDVTKYELMPFKYKLPANGPEPGTSLDSSDQYIHVDTGATVVFTNRPNELNDAIPTNFQCGTAADDGNTPVTNLGSFCFQDKDIKGRNIKFGFSNCLEVTKFKRRSLSVHVLRAMGYDAGHFVLTTGSYLWISKIQNESTPPSDHPSSMTFRLHQHNNSDFLKISILSGHYAKEASKSELPDGEVGALNLGSALSGEKLLGSDVHVESP